MGKEKESELSKKIADGTVSRRNEVGYQWGQMGPKSLYIVNLCHNLIGLRPLHEINIDDPN